MVEVAVRNSSAEPTTAEPLKPPAARMRPEPVRTPTCPERTEVRDAPAVDQTLVRGLKISIEARPTPPTTNTRPSVADETVCSARAEAIGVPAEKAPVVGL